MTILIGTGDMGGGDMGLRGEVWGRFWFAVGYLGPFQNPRPKAPGEDRGLRDVILWSLLGLGETNTDRKGGPHRQSPPRPPAPLPPPHISRPPMLVL